MKIFLICPVRGITEGEMISIERYVLDVERSGHHKVYWPPRDTNQNDLIGLRICGDNRQAIEDADEVHIWWDGKSQGSLFDLGMAFALKKKIFLVNFGSVQITPHKSFDNLLHALNFNGRKIYKVWHDGEIVDGLIPSKYAGWKKGKIFGRLDCKSGMLMKKENRIFFLTYDDAIKAGYRPCKNCKPKR